MVLYDVSPILVVTSTVCISTVRRFTWDRLYCITTQDTLGVDNGCLSSALVATHAETPSSGQQGTE